jgi:ATP-dependent DNA helicase RecG
MDTTTIEQYIRAGESLKVEFKGEQRESLSDREIYEAVVCLANADGGILLIGVENDGRLTGARPRHGATTDPYRLQAAIFNNTEPPINTRVSVQTVDGKPVIVIEVDPYPEICTTKDGKSLRRAMGVRGPECVPFYPYQHQSRRSDLGLFDYSAQLVTGASWADLDPLEFERLQQTINRWHGDAALLNLDNRELAQALQLVESRGEELLPNVAGLLLLGREESLRRFVPTHEVAFQVLDARGDVRMNDFFHGPLLIIIEEIQKRFDSRVEEEEVMIGMFRLPVPEYGRVAFREAMLNALLHRDFSQMGTVFVQWQHDHLLIANPGGLPEGITLQNILVHEPKPRNPRLYDAAKRIGLVEKTGRGVDKIFLDQLRLGRPAPSYERSDASGVRVVLRGGKANLAFAQFVYEQDKAGKALRLDELLILNQLEIERRIDTATATALIQKPEGDARAALESLAERGLIQAKGEKRGRVYHLSASTYKALGFAEAYVRTRGFEPLQQEQMVLQYVDAHGSIARSQAADLCQLSEGQASRLLTRMRQLLTLANVEQKADQN